MCTTWLALSLASALLAAAPTPHPAAVEKGLLPRTPVSGERAWTLQERMAHHRVQGLSVAVVDGFRIQWAKGYGFADTEAKRPVTARTRFQAGSVSKPVTALGALRLVEQGRLSLDAELNTQLKSWHLEGNALTARTPVTLRMVMGHSAGLTVHGFGGYEQGQPLPTIPEILDGKAPANSPPVRVELAPDTQFRYSGGGITLEQLAMGDVTGEAFPALMERLVLKPLGMADSTFRQPEVDDGSLPTGYRADATPVKGRYHLYPEMAAAGLWTTPTDLLKAALEIPAALRGRGRVLGVASARTMLTPRFTVSPDGEACIGQGWFLERHGEEVYFGHNGADEGFQCVLVFNARTGQGAAVMTNSDQGLELAMEVVRAIAQEYRWPGYLTPVHAVPLQPGRAAGLAGRYQLNGDAVLEVHDKGGRLFLRDRGEAPLWPLAQNLFVREDSDQRYRFEGERLIEIDHGKETSATRRATDAKVPSEQLEEGLVDEAIAGYRALRTANPGDPGLAEDRLNHLGYGFFGRKRLAEALALFTLNTEFHPLSCNAWDSLGEACAAAGRKAQAIASYRKALEVLPQDTAAPTTLKDTVKADAAASLALLEKQP